MPLLPRTFAQRQQAEDRRKLDKIIGTAEEVIPADSSGTPGGDEQRLRGLPAVSRHSAGAILGTNPVAALLAKER